MALKSSTEIDYDYIEAVPFYGEQYCIQKYGRTPDMDELRKEAFQCPYPVPPGNRTVHIFCHFVRKLEEEIRQYMHNYMIKWMDYFEKVGVHHFPKIGITADEYANRLLDSNTALDLFGVFIFARLYRIHIAVIVKGGVWTTNRTNNMRLAKFTLIYRGKTDFSETCSVNSTALYIDSLILNTEHGRMPCHRNPAKLENQVDTVQEAIDLTLDKAKNTDTKSSQKIAVENISSISVLAKPKNRNLTSTFNKAMKLLIKAKAEIKLKAECDIVSKQVTNHIQTVPVNPQEVPKRAREAKMITSVCEFCNQICRSRREYVRHRMQYHPGQSYYCKHCNQEYKSANGCYKHEHTHLSPGFPCGICGRTFDLWTKLRDHMPTHDATHKISCEDCGKMFSTKRTLKRHQEIHLGIKHACSLCGHSYDSKEQLRVHNRGFHGEGYTSHCQNFTFQWPGKCQRHQQNCTECKEIESKKKAKLYR